jgi:hypothetical protein
MQRGVTRTLILTLLGLTAMAPLAAQSDVLASLGTTPREAHDSIFSTVATGVVTLAGEKSVFKAATSEQRAAMVRAVVAIARTFIGSADFARRYAIYRDAQRPEAPAVAQSGDEALQQQQQQMELAIKQAMAAAAQLPADARKELEANVAEMRRQIAELNADSAYRDAVNASVVEGARLAASEHAKKMAAFDADYPADVDALIARRLRQFLLTCGEVDFAAQLETGKDKKQRFVNKAYEARSAEWKLCFRAGKPAVDAARAAATEWLKALDSQQEF